MYKCMCGIGHIHVKQRAQIYSFHEYEGMPLWSASCLSHGETQDLPRKIITLHPRNTYPEASNLPFGDMATP